MTTTHQSEVSLGAAEATAWSKPTIDDARMDWDEPKLQRLPGREALVGANTNNDATNFS